MSGFIIKPICSCGGFCSQLNHKLSWLYAADGNNHKVDFNESCTFKWCIWRKTVGKLNIWNEIFKPLPDMNNNTDDLPKELSSESNTKIKNTILYFSWDIQEEKYFNKYNLNSIYLITKVENKINNILNTIYDPKFNLIRSELNRVYRKNLIPKKIVIDKLNKYLKFFENYYVIGMHIRSSVHYKLEDKYNTNQIVDNFIEETNKLDLPQNTKIFIATASDQIKNKIENHFGKDKVISISTTRDSNNIIEANKSDILKNDWSYNKNYQNKMKNYGLVNYYIDVYLDVLLLANCNLILGGESNVFFNALIYNKELPFIIPSLLKNTGCR